MNHKLLQIYLRTFPPHSSRNTNQGFVLPMMVGLGLIMTLVGLTMIGRSSNDQNLATSQEQSSQSQAIAETGVTKVMDLLNTVRPLTNHDISNNVKYDDNDNNTDNNEVDYSKDEDTAPDWQDVYDDLTSNISCDDIEPYTERVTNYRKSAEDNDTWIEINNDQDRFRVLNYNYISDNPGLLSDPDSLNSSGTGVLTIEGQANFNQNTSTSVVEVKIPVEPKTGEVPGLYVQDNANIEKNKIDADLLIEDCDLDKINTGNLSDEREAEASPFAKFPPLPEVPSEYNEFKNGISSSTFGGNSTVELPRTGDDPDSEGVYHYLLGTSGDNSIDLKGGGKELIITSGEKVRFYMEGNVQMKGNAKIIHDCGSDPDCKPSNFHMYGGDGSDGSDDSLDTYNGNQTTRICLSGGSTVDAFIFAPEANVAVNGGGNNKANDGTNDESGEGITGTVWAKTWNDDPDGKNCGSESNKTLVTQNADWNDLPIARPRTINSPSNWQRRGVN